MAAILVIDDQLVSLQILAAIVSTIDKDHEVITFPCPQQALDWASSNHVALVITDYRMPKMNGIEFIRSLRAHHDGAPVPAILVSAEIESGVRQAAVEAGVSDILQKPVNHRECRERARALLAQAV